MAQHGTDDDGTAWQQENMPAAGICFIEKVHMQKG
jgi:hypothetical protein